MKGGTGAQKDNCDFKIGLNHIINSRDSNQTASVVVVRAAVDGRRRPSPLHRPPLLSGPRPRSAPPPPTTTAPVPPRAPVPRSSRPTPPSSETTATPIFRPVPPGPSQKPSGRRARGIIGGGGDGRYRRAARTLPLRGAPDDRRPPGDHLGQDVARCPWRSRLWPPREPLPSVPRLRYRPIC